MCVFLSIKDYNVNINSNPGRQSKPGSQKDLAAYKNRRFKGDVAMYKVRICSTFYPRDVVSAVYATAIWGWVAGCLSVTHRYCIKTAKPILKLFRPSGSPIILVSSDHAPIPNYFSGVVKYTGVGKMAIFDGNRRLSRKRYEIGR